MRHISYQSSVIFRYKTVEKLPNKYFFTALLAKQWAEYIRVNALRQSLEGVRDAARYPYDYGDPVMSHILLVNSIGRKLQKKFSGLQHGL